MYQSDVNFLLNVDFAYFVYLNQSGVITSEHWLMDTKCLNQISRSKSNVRDDLFLKNLCLDPIFSHHVTYM